mgnify:FL=1
MMRMTMTQLKMSSLTGNLSFILNKRYEYEQLVSYRNSFNLPSYNSDITSIRYFIDHGYKSNRLRKKYKHALVLANEIMEYYNENFSISSIHREAI